mmetsp:Transcript_59259/g.139833  ORF Transcript_59259/g.139833 Transcript_59259/m.139833 type:complete len:214 (-) Transcript_59259:1185-1826(-)
MVRMVSACSATLVDGVMKGLGTVMAVAAPVSSRKSAVTAPRVTLTTGRPSIIRTGTVWPCAGAAIEAAPQAQANRKAQSRRSVMSGVSSGQQGWRHPCSDRVTSRKSGSSGCGFTAKPRPRISLSMSVLFVSTRPSMSLRPFSRAASVMPSISREPRPLPPKSSATSRLNSQLVWSGLVMIRLTPTMRSASSKPPSSRAVRSPYTATRAISRS